VHNCEPIEQGISKEDQAVVEIDFYLPHREKKDYERE
jgi:hypothetical protein